MGSTERGALAQMTAAKSLPLPSMRLVADDTHRSLNILRVQRLAGSDGVHPWGKPCEDLEELLRIGDDAGEVGERVDKLTAPAIFLCKCLAFCAGHRFQAIVRGRQLRHLRDASARQLADRETRTQRLFEIDVDLVVIEHTLIAIHAKRCQHLIHRAPPVLRHDSDRISRRVGHPRFYRQFDMARLFLRTLCGQQVVRQNF